MALKKAYSKSYGQLEYILAQGSEFSIPLGIKISQQMSRHRKHLLHL